MSTIETVAGIHGTELTSDILAQLPGSAPPAPWALDATCLGWFAPPNRATGRALQPGMTGTPLAIAGMFVSYNDTPVGPYDEIIGSVGLRRGRGVVGHIPFIAVDSAASVVGGRANWSLPKTLAAFEGHPVRDHAMTGRHGEWEVSASARVLGPAVPSRLAFGLAQVAPDGSTAISRTSARARARPALVKVETSGTPELTSWLRSGRYPGIVIESFRAEFGASSASS